jgi:hypothetical protein
MGITTTKHKTDRGQTMDTSLQDPLRGETAWPARRAAAPAWPAASAWRMWASSVLHLLGWGAIDQSIKVLKQNQSNADNQDNISKSIFSTNDQSINRPTLTTLLITVGTENLIAKDK